MKHVLITLLAALALLPAFATIATDQEISAHSGVIEIRDTQVWLIDELGDELRLLLAPASLLDSLGLVFAAGDTLAAAGIRSQNLLLVSKIWAAKDQDPIVLRDLEQGKVETGGTASYRVDTQTCIGCRLCVNPCPTGAIAFSRGRAYIDPAKCTECGICVEGNGSFRGCPVGAIKKD